MFRRENAGTRVHPDQLPGNYWRSSNKWKRARDEVSDEAVEAAAFVGSEDFQLSGIVHRSAGKLLSHRARHRSQRQTHQCKAGGVTAARPTLICEKLSVTAKPPSHTKTGGFAFSPYDVGLGQTLSGGVEP
jgi:hypothetical protein